VGDDDGDLLAVLLQIVDQLQRLARVLRDRDVALAAEAGGELLPERREDPLLVVDTQNVLTHGQWGCVHAGPDFVSTAPPRRKAIPRACSGPSIGMRTSNRV